MGELQGAVVLVAVCLGGWIGWIVVRDWHIRHRYVRVLATVTGHRQRLEPRDEDTPERWNLWALFDFTTRDSLTVRGECRAWERVRQDRYPRFHTGEQVWIRYHPLEPSRIALEPEPLLNRLLLNWLARRMAGPADGPSIAGLLTHLGAAVKSTPYSITVHDSSTRGDFTLELDLSNRELMSAVERHEIRHSFRIVVTVDRVMASVTMVSTRSELRREADRRTGRWILVADRSERTHGREFTHEKRILEFGEHPEELHSYTLIEASSWLRREARAGGFRWGPPRERPALFGSSA